MARFQEAPQTRNILSAILGLVVLSGCSSFDPKLERMIPENISPGNRLGETACIDITGEGATDSSRWLYTGIWFPPLMFAKAIDSSLLQAGLFDGIVDCDANPQYRLEIFLAHVQGKAGATRFSSSYGTVVAHWKLTRRIDEEILLDKEITGRFVLRSSGDPGRALRSVEGAAKDNIRQGVSLIAALTK